MLLMVFREEESQQFERGAGHKAEQMCIKPQGAQRKAGDC